MALGGKTQFGVPIFEPKVFRKQMYRIEESSCDNVGTFRHRPQWFGAQGIVPPFPPRIRH